MMVDGGSGGSEGVSKGESRGGSRGGLEGGLVAVSNRLPVTVKRSAVVKGAAEGKGQ